MKTSWIIPTIHITIGIAIEAITPIANTVPINSIVTFVFRQRDNDRLRRLGLLRRKILR